ncbi:MAG: ankyrin repeat domain-containing protein [Gemmatimonadota bacterium]
MPDAIPPEPALAFLSACARGDLEGIQSLLDADPSLVHSRDSDGATGVHRALLHPAAVRLLLSRGADPNARELGDNALPLHFAAGGAPVETVRALLEAGSDVHGEGDVHRLEPIGWATVFADPRPEVVELLLAHGARHHVFSAIALGDEALVRAVVSDDPMALARRLSPSEQEQSALHYVIAPPDGLLGGTFRTGAHYRTLDVLLELGADVEARDARGRTPMQVAMLRGDLPALQALQRAGAALPDEGLHGNGVEPAVPAYARPRMAPMLCVTDMARSIAWYEAVGFQVSGSHGDEGGLDFVSLVLDGVELMCVPAHPPRTAPTAGLTLWIHTEALDRIYERLRGLQLHWAREALEGREPSGPPVPFIQDLHTAFYGQREFGVRDPDGVEVMFAQEVSR